VSTLVWIVASGTLMSALALVGSLTLVVPERTFKKLVMPMVSLAAGSLLGGALFHMLPESVDEIGNTLALWTWLAGTTATNPSPPTAPSGT
jgi:zinc and cadmium transporter